MAEIKLVFAELEDAYDYAKKVSTECTDYASELNKDVAIKFASLPSSPLDRGNSYTDLASDLVAKKKDDLAKKATRYTNFASKINTLKTNAQDADKAVAKNVNDTLNAFLKAHTNLSGDGWAAFFATVVVDVPVIGWLFEKADAFVEGVKTTVVNLRYWYEVCGGKKIVDTALAIGGLVLAAIGAVVAIVGVTFTGPIWGIIVSVAAAVGAVIALVNAAVNVYQQFKANGQDDPAWAQYYGGIDSASDALRKTTFKSDFMNKWSGRLATAIDVVDTICSIISVADGIKNLYNKSGLNKLFGDKQTLDSDGKKIKLKNGEHYQYKFNFDKFKQTIFSSDGRAKIKSTLSKNWKYVVFGNPKQDGYWKSKGKQYSRAMKSIDIDGWSGLTKIDNLEGIEKLSGMIKSDYSKITNIGKTIDLLKNGFSKGFKLKDVYTVGSMTYDGLEKGGVIKSGMSTYDSISGLVSNISGYNEILNKVKVETK